MLRVIFIYVVYFVGLLKTVTATGSQLEAGKAIIEPGLVWPGLSMTVPVTGGPQSPVSSLLSPLPSFLSIFLMKTNDRPDQGNQNRCLGRARGRSVVYTDICHTYHRIPHH